MKIPKGNEILAFWKPESGNLNKKYFTRRVKTTLTLEKNICLEDTLWACTQIDFNSHNGNLEKVEHLKLREKVDK